ncbi:MAG: response regulator [Lachnospiraceae bacterium]|nr:response regulator [Lachnospiraceae bacterium]
MAKNRMIVTGEKESFIARVLIKKVKDTGTDCIFVPCTIDDLNKYIRDSALITLCLGDEERPREDVLHFIAENMEDNDLQMIVVGEARDIEYINENIPHSLIHETFTRPVDNVEFARTVTEYLKKVEAGDFKKSILIVDDDPSYLKLVREWLKDKYKVAMANSGLQAIKWLGKNKADLILLDHEMPVTSGPQVLEMLRSDPETQDIPVIFLTGKGDKESVMAVVELKPEGYFLKTIKKEELLEKLNAFFIIHK